MNKRIFDLVAAGAGLILLAPLFAMVALWIRIDSPGPVFFRQQRVGRLGVHFDIFKFRTMAGHAGAEDEAQLTIGRDRRITQGRAANSAAAKLVTPMPTTNHTGGLHTRLRPLVTR